jgi:heme/copper-type cytochrome/quinol oxidase subunit 3
MLPLLASIVLGGLFVGLQGVEWVALLAEGLTLTSSSHGSFFYLIVGAHGAHALGALLALGYVAVRLARGSLQRSELVTVELFWAFVVVLWPFIYARVYF